MHTSRRLNPVATNWPEKVRFCGKQNGSSGANLSAVKASDLVAPVGWQRLRRLCIVSLGGLFSISQHTRLRALGTKGRRRPDTPATGLLASHSTTPPQLGEVTGSRPHENPLFRLIDIVSVFAFVVFQGAGWVHVLRGSDGSSGTLLLLTLSSFVVSWLFADFASGAVHYAADHFGDERTPVLGRFIISTFRQHHDHPEAMLRHGFFERNGNCALIALVAISWVPWVDPSNGWKLFLAMSALFVGLWTLGTNQFHAWAHATERPRWVNLLQRSRIILSPRHHHMHHVPFEQGATPATPQAGPQAGPGNYCITHGNCEFFLSALIRLTLTNATGGADHLTRAASPHAPCQESRRA